MVFDFGTLADKRNAFEKQPSSDEQKLFQIPEPPKVSVAASTSAKSIFEPSQEHIKLHSDFQR